ncbi:MAG: hypothetical protein LBH87_01215 [Coriobacteriales bacterium]|jgi:hypothetical protein|nr:hypothetical protein [Coriobacteriales bacterium]
MVDQLTVFLENEPGRLAALTTVLGEASISMRALTVADADKYGVVRILADHPVEAYEILNSKGFRVALTKVFAVEVPDVAGGLSKLLTYFQEAGVNVDYAYCFLNGKGRAIDILRTDNLEKTEQVIAKAGFKSLSPEDLCA